MVYKKTRLRLLSALCGLSIVISGCGGNYTSRASSVSGSTKYVDPTFATRVYQGIQEVGVSDQGDLRIQLIERRLSPEFEAPVIVDKVSSGERANPVGSVIGAAFTIGLYPLFAPKKFLEQTFGKTTEERVLSSNPDKTRARKTGREEWITLPLRGARVNVAGLPVGGIRTLSTNSDGVISLDLAGLYLASGKYQDSHIEIRFDCQTCQSTSATAELPATRTLKYELPPAWRLVKNHQADGGVLWIPRGFYDRAMSNGSLQDSSASSSAPESSDQPLSWRLFSAAVALEAQKLLQSKQALPNALVKERERLKRIRPKGKVTLTRDEFESSIAFKARVEATQREERRQIAAYNKAVDDLNQKIQRFRQNAPRSLTTEETAAIMGKVLQNLVGAPEVKSVAYDADLERFIVSVGGSSTAKKSEIQFSLISADRVPPAQARLLKDRLFQSSPFIRFDLKGTSLSPVSAHLLSDTRLLSFRFAEGFDVPKFQTVRLESAELKSPEVLTKLKESDARQDFQIKPTADAETQRLRQQLDNLRESLETKRQVEAERESLSSEIKRLEEQLSNIDRGEFKDDLQGAISAISTPAKEDPNLHVVVVGIDTYSELPRVIFSDRSARMFAEVAVKKLGAPQHQVISLVNDEATGVRLLSRLRSISSKLGPKDKLLFYFAGHSAPTKDNQVVLIPYDATAEILVTDDLRLKGLVQTLLKSQAEHVWIVLDSCFSGRTDNNEFIYRDTAPILLAPKSGILPPESSRLTVLAAGGVTDFANASRATGHRLFSYHLLRELIKGSALDPTSFVKISRQVRLDATSLGPTYSQAPEWLGAQRALLGGVRVEAPATLVPARGVPLRDLEGTQGLGF